MRAIRKELIDYVFEYYGDKGITKDFIAKIIDRTLSSKDYDARIIRREEDFEKEKLFGQSIEGIHNFLNQMKEKYGEGTIEERWSGYEDNYLVYSFNSLENENEIYLRLKEVVFIAIRKEVEKIVAEKNRNDRIAKLERELAILKGKQ